MQKILLIEDDLVLSNVVTSGLLSAGIQCSHLSSYSEAKNFIESSLNTKPDTNHSKKAPKRGHRAPDAIVIDYYLDKGMTGLSLCKTIRSLSDVPIVMLTGERSINTIVACLNEGADQYVSKPFVLEELVARINASIRSRVLAQPLIGLKSSNRLLSLDANSRELRCGARCVRLTEKESLLCELLMKTPNNPASRQEILEHVYGPKGDVYGRCIDMLVARLRSKLKMADAHAKILSLRNLGYKLASRSND